MGVYRAGIVRGVCAGMLGAALMLGTAATADAAPSPEREKQARCFGEEVPKALATASAQARGNRQTFATVLQAEFAKVYAKCGSTDPDSGVPVVIA